jgi:hypothetical protein
MADSRTAETLRKKRGEIDRSIDDYDARPAQAKADLAQIDAAIAIFASGHGQKPFRPYVDIFPSRGFLSPSGNFFVSRPA